MTIQGLHTITPVLDQPGFFVKCILNREGAVFFPGEIQHRDMKRNGLSYEDDYAGNAMAATITPKTIDIRFHQDFTDDTVRIITGELLSSPEMTWAKGYTVRYQGRTLQ